MYEYNLCTIVKQDCSVDKYSKIKALILRSVFYEKNTCNLCTCGIARVLLLCLCIQVYKTNYWFCSDFSFLLKTNTLHIIYIFFFCFYILFIYIYIYLIVRITIMFCRIMKSNKGKRGRITSLFLFFFSFFLFSFLVWLYSVIGSVLTIVNIHGRRSRIIFVIRSEICDVQMIIKWIGKRLV